jgi:hypothetical protein
LGDALSSHEDDEDFEVPKIEATPSIANAKFVLVVYC